MVQRPPYWIAARIFRAAAGTAGRRISGQYTLNTGRDFADLAPHLQLHVIEAWYFEHFEKQKSVDDWLRMLNEPPTPLPDDVWAVCGRAAVRTAERILQQVVGAPLELAAPPGWDAETLLAESLAVAQGSL